MTNEDPELSSQLDQHHARHQRLQQELAAEDAKTVIAGMAVPDDWFKFPDADTPEYQAAVEALQQATAENDALLAELVQHVQGLDTLISRFRLMVFLDFHLGTIDGRKPVAARWQRLAYEMAVQRAAHTELLKMREVVAAKLREVALKGGQVANTQRASGLIIPPTYGRGQG